MEIKRQFTASEALAAFDALAANTNMNREAHERFKAFTRSIANELIEFAQLKAEHAKCTSESSTAHSPDREVGSEGNGSQLGEGGSPLGASIPVQELIQ